MTQHKTLRRIGWLVAGLVAIAGVVLGIVLGTPLPQVEVGHVTRGSWERVVAEDGRARVRERYVVSSPLGGTLERVTLHAGDCVARGDTLATLHPAAAPLLDARSRAELEARRSAAEAALASARVTVERTQAASAHAQTELARARQLSRSGTLTPRELEHAELDALVASRERDAARFAVDVAGHELEMIRASLAEGAADATRTAFELHAPIDGCLLHVQREDEGPIAAGTPILELGDRTSLEVVVDLLSTDAVNVEPGVDATLEGFGAGEPISGRVRLVEPTASIHVSALGVEEQRVDVVVDPLETSEAWARVGDGYRVDVRVTVERVEDTLRVPTSALFRVGDGWSAFVVEAGRVRRVPVDVTHYGPVESAVGEGLAEGTTLVVEPPDDLEEGTRVTTRDASAR